MFPLFQQATFLLGDQLPKCIKLDSVHVRQLLEDFDLLLSRLLTGQPRSSLFQTLTPPQWNQILWSEIASSLKSPATAAATATRTSVHSSSDDEDAEDAEEATVPIQESHDRGEQKEEAPSDLSAATSLDSMEAVRLSITDRLSQDAELRKFLVHKYGPRNKTAALACLRAVVMDPAADHFSSPDLASSYVAKFESALRWCGEHAPSRKKLLSAFIAGVQPKSMRDFLSKEDHIKIFTVLLVCFISEYSSLCEAMSRIGVSTMEHQVSHSYNGRTASNNIHNNNYSSSRESNNNNFSRHQPKSSSATKRDDKQQFHLSSRNVSNGTPSSHRDNSSSRDQGRHVDHNSSDSRREPREPRESRESRSEPIKCDFCHKIGHIARDCRSRLASLSSASAPPNPPSERHVTFADAPHDRSQRPPRGPRSGNNNHHNRLNKMIRIGSPGQMDIPVVAVQLFAAVGAESLGLKAELDSGSQVDLIPDMWIPWLLNLGCFVRPCHLNVLWIKDGATLRITHSVHVYLHFPAYSGRVQGGWLDLCIHSSTRPELTLSIQTMRRFDLFKLGDDLARIHRSLGLLASAESPQMEPVIPTLDGHGHVDLDAALGPSVSEDAAVPLAGAADPILTHPCDMTGCTCSNFAPSEKDVVRCSVCNHGWSVHSPVAVTSPSTPFQSALQAGLTTVQQTSEFRPLDVYSSDDMRSPTGRSRVVISRPPTVQAPAPSTAGVDSVTRTAASPAVSRKVGLPRDLPPLISDSDSEDDSDDPNYDDMPELRSDVSSDSDSETDYNFDLRARRPPPAAPPQFATTWPPTEFEEDSDEDSDAAPSSRECPPPNAPTAAGSRPVPEGLTIADGPLRQVLSDLSSKLGHVFSDTLPPDAALVPPMSIPLKADFVPEADYHFRRFAPKVEDALMLELEGLLRSGVIELVEQQDVLDISFAAPVVMVPKPSGGWRLCVDYRRLNAGISCTSFPLAHIEDILQGCKGKKYFARLDLLKGFWQFLIAPADRYKTAFRVRHNTYVFRRVPMGLLCSPFYLQKTMSSVLAGLLGLGVFLYLDDIVIVGDTEEEFISNYLAVLQRLDQYKLELNAKKCLVGVPELPLLGHIVDGEGLRQSPDRIAGIQSIPMPKTPRELRRFLGSTNFMRRFIPNYSILAAPLNALTTGDRKALKSRAALAAFDQLKQAVADQIGVHHLDYALPLIVSTDASTLGLGATLANLYPDGSKRIIACISHKFTKAEARWKTIEQEAFAIVFALQHWRDFLYGHHFVLETDHRNLTYIHAGSSPKLTRWLLTLQEFDYGTVHVPGELHVFPDLLSRFPLQASSSPRSVADATIAEPQLQRRSEEEVHDDLRAVELEDFESESLSDLEGALPSALRLGFTRRDPSTTRPTDDLPHPKLPPPTGISPAEALEYFHRVHNASQGHLGITRTLNLLQQRGWTWPNMARDVTNFVHACGVCQKERPSRAHVETIRGQLSSYALFEELAIDFIGPLPRDDLQNAYIFNAICSFSRFTELIPVEAPTAVIAAHCLLSIVARYGCFRRLRSDRGTHFVNTVIDEFLDLF